MELGDGEVLLSGNGGLTVGEIDGSDCASGTAVTV